MRALLLLCCVLAFTAKASDSLQPIPALTGPVVDLTGTLTAAQQQALSDKLRAFHQQRGPQIQILIIPTSAPEDAFTYSMRVVDRWKLGDKQRDDGVLLFIAKQDRAFQMQVGYGLEGTIPDVIAKRLLEELMVPHFKQGNFYKGLDAVVDGVFARITGDSALAPPVETSSRSANRDDWIPFFVIIAVVTLQIMKVALGRLTAGVVGGPLMVLLGWLMGIQLVFVLFLTFMILVGGLSPSRGGRYSGGGGFGGGGGWSGGGGGFGGGGAGGRW